MDALPLAHIELCSALFPKESGLTIVTHSVLLPQATHFGGNSCTSFRTRKRYTAYYFYAAYGWLILSGFLHFVVDVLLQYFRAKRAAGPAITLYYGLNSTYALSQVLFAALALFAVRQGMPSMGKGEGLALGFLAACAWFVLCLLFIEYPQPRIAVVIFGVLLTGVAVTGLSFS